MSAAFVVVGVSPERLAQARRKHDERGAHWNPNLYVRLVPAKPVRGEPFVDRDEAERFAATAAASGWLGIRVEAMEGPP